MDAKIAKDGEIFVVYLRGQLDYDTALPFRQTCMNHLVREKVVFNLAELSFVGSKGIVDFIETMVQLSQKTIQGIRFCRVSCEFRRILESSDVKDLQIFDDELSAKSSFYRPTAPLITPHPLLPEDELA